MRNKWLILMFIVALSSFSTMLTAHRGGGGGERGGERFGGEHHHFDHSMDRHGWDHHGDVNINDGGGDNDGGDNQVPYNPDWDEDPDVESVYEQNQNQNS